MGKGHMDRAGRGRGERQGVVTSKGAKNPSSSRGGGGGGKRWFYLALAALLVGGIGTLSYLSVRPS